MHVLIIILPNNNIQRIIIFKAKIKLMQYFQIRLLAMQKPRHHNRRGRRMENVPNLLL